MKQVSLVNRFLIDQAFCFAGLYPTSEVRQLAAFGGDVALASLGLIFALIAARARIFSEQNWFDISCDRG